MTHSRGSILVVDDDAVTRHILYDYLVRAGYEAIVAASGQEALERLRSTPVSLVLLDLVLPDVDGYDVLRQIREGEHSRDVPVVVLTALEGDDEIARAFEEGADDFLHKPFRNAELIARIRGQLRLRSYLFEIAQKEHDAAVLVELTQALATNLDIRQILHSVVRKIAETVQVDRCSIIVAREGSGRGFVVAASDDAGVHNLPIELEKYPEIQQVLQTRQPLTIDDASKHPLLDPVRSTAKYHSLMLLPIAFEDRPLGVLFLRAMDGRAKLSDRELAFCKIAANATAVALRNARVLQQLRDETVALDTRAHAAESKARSLEQYHLLFRSAADGIMVFDKSTVVRFVNPRGSEILGRTTDQIINQRIGKFVFDEDLQQAKAAAEASQRGERVSLDVRVRHESEVLTLSVSLSPLESDGSTVIATFRDVSAERATALELSRTRDFLTALIESSPDAIVAADVRGRILVWNRAAERICGMPREEVIGQRNVAAIYPVGIAQQIMARLREGESSTGMARLENFRTELITPTGEEIPIHLSAAIVRENGRDAGTIGIFSDLRDRIHMEARLAHAQERLKMTEKQSLVAQLAGTAAHELNQPLTSIMGYAELLKRRSPDDSHAVRASTVIIQEAERMADIVRKLGNMSRLDTKDYVGATKIFDLERNSQSQDEPPTEE
ncbi:MAG: PAS domain S-box protein [Deltaproteobacteria bacterium]|nr:PAS domain S-box protein [Deltaproteobacteria bacterium]